MYKIAKKEKGITLVALVATIIILLILAGITLSTTLGNKGIFSRAISAKEAYEKAKEDEERKLENLYSSIKIADNDDAEITINMKDLQTIIDERVNEIILEGTKQEIYSEQETVIGTWIDGKTLYRKVINFGELPNTGVKNVEHNIENADTLYINYGKSYVQSTDGEYRYGLNNTGSANNIQWQAYTNNQYVSVWAGMDRTAFTAYITLEYTKKD